MDKQISVQDSNDNAFLEMFNIPSESVSSTPRPLEMALSLFSVLGGACVILAAIQHWS